MSAPQEHTSSVLKQRRLRFFPAASAAAAVPPSPSLEKTTGKPDSTEQQQQEVMTLSQILTRAGKRGLGGGIPGAIAGVVQVLSMMWLRTICNHQYRYGTTFSQALRMLWKEGGVRRFYRGLSFALVQAPLVRFVSTAANDGVETLLASLDFSKGWGPGRTTLVASVVVGMWRMLLMPVDTCKTVLQVDSAEGFKNLMRKVRAGKVGVLYEGALANAFSAVAAHYPWFFTYNALSRNDLLQSLLPSRLLRNGVIGFLSSLVSDSMTNCVRVVKTTKQALASKHSITYWEAIQMILAADGWKGLFGRGLRTRIMTNAMQSIIFTIIWRGLAERWRKTNSPSPQKPSSSPPSSTPADKSSKGGSGMAEESTTSTAATTLSGSSSSRKES